MADKITKLPEIRVLTRRQVKELRKLGYDPMVISDDNAAELTEAVVGMVDWILDNVYSDHDFDDMDYSECVKFASKTYKRTMGTDEEIKNS